MIKISLFIMCMLASYNGNYSVCINVIKLLAIKNTGPKYKVGVFRKVLHVLLMTGYHHLEKREYNASLLEQEHGLLSYDHRFVSILYTKMLGIKIQ